MKHQINGCRSDGGFYDNYTGSCQFHQQLQEILHVGGAIKDHNQSQPVLENGSFRLYYDRPIITDKAVTNNRPDVMVYEKKGAQQQ